MSIKSSGDTPALSESTSALEALLELPDKLFVTAAYQAVLGRNPDPGGFEHYVAQVRAGNDKARILAELAQSPEGRMRSKGVPGLDRILVEYRRTPSSFWGRIYHRLAGAANEPTERQVRVIDNRLRVVEQGLARQAEQIADLRELALKMLATSGSEDPVDRAPNDQGAILSNNIAQISPSIARIYLELKTAIAMKR